MTSKSLTNLQDYAGEDGWLVYCHDDEDVLHIHGVYKTEDDARQFLKTNPYFFMSDEANLCIKYKIKQIEIKKATI
jgi:hypothetical protein